MTPATAVLIGLVISVLQFLGTMFFFSVKMGEYKNQVDGIPKAIDSAVAPVKVSADAAVASANKLHERFDNFWVELGELKGRVGSTEGQLERINGKGH
jgi:hypothetical protein